MTNPTNESGCLPAPEGCTPETVAGCCGAVASYRNEKGHVVPILSDTREPDPACGCWCHDTWRWIHGRPREAVIA